MNRVPLLNQAVTIRVRGVERRVSELHELAATRRALGHLVYVGWYDVTGTPIAEGELAAIAGRVRVESVLDYVSFASAEILAHPPPEVTTQLRHAQITLAGSNLTRVRDLLQAGAFDVFIHHEQLLSAAKLALLHGESGPARHDEDMPGIGTLLLAVNDALLDTPAEMDLDEAGRRVARALVARRAAFRSNEQPNFLIARYYDLLLRRPALARASGRIGLDFNERFVTGTGLTIEQFIALSYLSTIPFLRPDHGEAADVPADDEGAPEPGVPWDVIGRVLQEITDDEFYVLLQDRLSLEREAWSERLSAQTVDIEHLERIELYRHPLFRRTDGTLVPINVGIVAENMSLGAYWTLHSACSELDRRSGVNDLTSDIGALFEDYIDDLLYRSYHAAPHAVFHGERRAAYRLVDDARSFLDPYERAPGQRVDPTDAVVVEPTGIVMLEATVRNIPVAALLSAVPGSIDEYIPRITHKFRQIREVATDVAQGRLIIPGVDTTRSIDAYPVVVLLHPFPQHHLTWEALEAGIGDGGLLKVDSSWISMQPPQLLTCEELEMLEPHLSEGVSLVSLLREKIASRQFNHRTMKDFLLHGYGLNEIPNRQMDRLYTEAFDLVKTLVQPHLRATWDAATGDG